MRVLVAASHARWFVGHPGDRDRRACNFPTLIATKMPVHLFPSVRRFPCKNGRGDTQGEAFDARGTKAARPRTHACTHTRASLFRIRSDARGPAFPSPTPARARCLSLSVCLSLGPPFPRHLHAHASGWCILVHHVLPSVPFVCSHVCEVWLGCCPCGPSTWWDE